MAIYMWREYEPPELCFTANTASSTVQLTKTGSPTAVTLETSTDGTTWTDYTIGNTITLANIGDKVYMRNKSGTDTGFSTSSSNYYKFVMTGSIAASGDIGYLINKNSTMNGALFIYLFKGCTSLTRCPSLPQTTVVGYGYYWMFDGCTNLITLPILPALEINTNYYTRMFSGCSKIKISTTQTGEYQNAYRLPITGTGTTSSTPAPTFNMFMNTGGTYTGNISMNTTYYTSNQVI